MRHPELFSEMKTVFCHAIEEEAKLLCNPYNGFMLWKSSADDLKAFSFENLFSDLQMMSPIIFSIFCAITNNSQLSTCAAAAIALRGREARLSAFAYYIDNVLLYGGAKKAAFKRLAKLGITTSHVCAVGKQKELASTCGADLHLLKVANEIYLNSVNVSAGDTEGVSSVEAVGATSTCESELEGAQKSVMFLSLSGKKNKKIVLVIVIINTNTLICFYSICILIDNQSSTVDTASKTTDATTSATEQQENKTRQYEGFDLTFCSITDEEMEDLGVSSMPTVPNTLSSPPRTFSLIFDNLDFFIRTHHQSLAQGNTSLHWIHHIAVEDRVPIYHLSREKSVKSVMDYDIGKSLPGPDIQRNMRLEFVVLGSQILTNYLHAFQPLSDVVIYHIPHQYSSEMAEASVHVCANMNIVSQYIKVCYTLTCLFSSSTLLVFYSKMRIRQVTWSKFCITCRKSMFQNAPKDCQVFWLVAID